MVGKSNKKNKKNRQKNRERKRKIILNEQTIQHKVGGNGLGYCLFIFILYFYGIENKKKRGNEKQ
jgi:hypothetical protein